VEPDGGTPLFRAVIDGVSALTAGDEREPDDRTGMRALVVLTDGVDTTSGVAPAEAARQVAGRGVRIVVVALGDVRCADAGLAGLADRTGGECVQSSAAALPEQVQQIVSQLRGGQS
jgi:Ca-activated chloride channel homolog